MLKLQLFNLQKKEQKPDGIGGFNHVWSTSNELSGFLDLVTRTNQPSIQNASIESSTHVLIVPDYPSYPVTDKMRIVDSANRWYTITYVDDPVGQGRHLELYLTFGGVLNGV